MRVADLIERLKRYDPDMMVRTARYDPHRGHETLAPLTILTLFTDEEGTVDLTDRERDKDIETLILR